MKTINLLTLANGSVERTEDDGAKLIAANGMTIKLSALQFMGMQIWLREINKRKLPRRMAVGDLLFTLDNVDSVKPELYDVQYKAAIESLRLKKGEEITFTTVDYDHKRYLQMNGSPFAAHVADDVVELVFAFAMIGTPAMLDVVNDPIVEFASLFEKMLGDLQLGNITTVMRRVPVLNAQLDIMTLAESMVAHPEMTSAELAKQEAEAEAAKLALREKALAPYNGILDDIFGCAYSLLKLEPAEVQAA